MSEMSESERAAQQWHDTDHGDDPRNGNCWCCCIRCDPDWEHERPNPYWGLAILGKNLIFPPGPA